jgi:hypothetical protein
VRSQGTLLVHDPEPQAGELPVQVLQQLPILTDVLK